MPIAPNVGAGMNSQNYKDLDEIFVLRVQDAEVAEKLRKVLREDEPNSRVELKFEDATDGHLLLGGVKYPAAVLSTPTVVEAYKTYDDTNLVKTGDIGQIVVVRPPGAPRPTGAESVDGITPSMKNARQNFFLDVPKVAPEIVEKVEVDVLQILAGKAPHKLEFHDVEQEYVVDENGVGRWVDCVP